jgi:diguanylate cyclase (GGDEF)-like protein
VSSFAPTECWALRLGHPHLAPDGAHGQRCSHAPHGATTALCVPLVTSGECMGLLQLQGLTLEREGGIGPVVERLIQAAAGQVGLALLNLSLRERLRAQSIRDPLTGLFNRRFFEETFEAELARAGRNGTSLALLMVDVDFFKRLNDTFGHLAGDATLKELGALFRTSVRAGDVACRLGGEEFALLMPDIDASVVRQRANALRASGERLLVEYHAEVVGPVTVSVGIARFPDHGRDAVALLREADAALYRAKAEGRNRVCEAAGPSA